MSFDRLRHAVAAHRILVGERRQLLPLARPVFLAERQRARRRLYVRVLLLSPVAVALLGAFLFP